MAIAIDLASGFNKGSCIHAKNTRKNMYRNSSAFMVASVIYLSAMALQSVRSHGDAPDLANFSSFVTLISQ